MLSFWWPLRSRPERRAGRRRPWRRAPGVSALAEAAVLIFSSAALGLVGAVRLVRLRGRDRFVLAAALVVAALLAALAGGPVSDALFGRGGTAGMARLAFEPNWVELAPFDLTGPALVRVGVIPLTVVSALVAFRRRSWGLAYLTAAGAFGLAEAMFLQSPIPMNDARILEMASVVAWLAALSGVGWLVAGLRGWRRAVAILAVTLVAILPTVLPRGIAAVRLASEGVAVRPPATDGSGFPFVGQAKFYEELEADWDFYAWLARALSNEARLLTTHPGLSAAVAGVAAPTSGRGAQVLSPSITPEYEDALRFLHRDDLAELEITHLHVTDRLAEALLPEARRLLDDPEHFRVLVDLRSVSAVRHRVFEALPGAGTRTSAPSSFRLLREIVPADAPVVLLDGLTRYQRRMLLFTLIDHDDLRASETFINRVTRAPGFRPVSDIPGRGVAALPDYVEPLMLGLSRDDALWAGYGMRVYDLAGAWTPVWRIGPDGAGLPEGLRHVCESSLDEGLDLRLLGEPGDLVAVGLAQVRLIGSPQVIDPPLGDCKTLSFAAHAEVAPFAQVRPARSSARLQPKSTTAGLGFDGGVAGDQVTLNFWYRNPRGLLFAAGTEFRLYEVGPMGVTPLNPNPRDSIRWWNGPLLLKAKTQMARIAFDPRRLEINGDAGGGAATALVPGRTYLLTLNVAATGTRSGHVEIQQQIPLVRIVAGDAGVSSQVLSGIVTLEPRAVNTSGWFPEYAGGIGWEVDLTPQSPAAG